MALVALWTAWVAWRRRDLSSHRWLLRTLVCVAPFGFLATESGWIVTEVGRQPWVVYRVLLTKDAVTRAPIVPVGYVTLVVVYVGLAVAVAWILRRLARAPLPEA